MDFVAEFRRRIFEPGLDFETSADELWAWQLEHNAVMQQYCALLGNTKRRFIPISFFRDRRMTCGEWEGGQVFESSGTTGQLPSRHFVRDLSLYEQSALEGYRHFWGEEARCILALLPSYLERGNSSLVYMVKTWMDRFGLPGSGFYLYNFEALAEQIAGSREPLLLIGVSFALLDFAEQYPTTLPPGSVVMETGGMKGRREELIREELHTRLRKGLGVPHIASEYGMTELLSQAYALQEGRFRCPPWMRVFISDPHLSRLPAPEGATGRINFIDLANLHSCAFISTDDLGRNLPDGSFEVLGRMDGAMLRGCSLMYGQ